MKIIGEFKDVIRGIGVSGNPGRRYGHGAFGSQYDRDRDRHKARRRGASGKNIQLSRRWLRLLDRVPCRPGTYKRRILIRATEFVVITEHRQKSIRFLSSLATLLTPYHSLSQAPGLKRPTEDGYGYGSIVWVGHRNPNGVLPPTIDREDPGGPELFSEEAPAIM